MKRSLTPIATLAWGSAGGLAASALAQPPSGHCPQFEVCQDRDGYWRPSGR